jgi:hypothetical protein
LWCPSGGVVVVVLRFFVKRVSVELSLIAFPRSPLILLKSTSAACMSREEDDSGYLREGDSKPVAST